MEEEVEATRRKVINRISEEKSLLLDNRTNRFKMLHGSFSFGDEFLRIDGSGSVGETCWQSNERTIRRRKLSKKALRLKLR